MREEELLEENQQAPKIFPYVCPNTVEVPETDTSPAKTRAVSQGVTSTERIERPDAASGAIEMGGRTNESDDELSTSEICTEKKQSFSEADVSQLVDLERDSVADLLGEGGPRAHNITGEAITKVIVVESRVSPFVNSSTPVKLPVEVGRGSSSLKVTPVALPPKRAADVIFTVDEGVEGLLGSARPAKSSECDLWNSSRTATSVGGVTTDISLS